MAIGTLREGDLVVARNEDTGQSGTFPVTALMAHQAAEVLWLTLENADGKTTRMGVTANHPLFIAGIGWGDAGELVAGDAIRDSMLKELTVLAVEVDTAPQMVHNLEIAEAHTYFAGELEAWGHNGRVPFKAVKDTVRSRDGCKCVYCGIPLNLKPGFPNSLEYDHFWPFSRGGGRGVGNIVCSCRTCNRGFGNRLPGEGKPTLGKF